MGDLGDVAICTTADVYEAEIGVGGRDGVVGRMRVQPVPPHSVVIPAFTIAIV